MAIQWVLYFKKGELEGERERQDWVFEVKLQIRFDFDFIKLSFDQLGICF